MNIFLTAPPAAEPVSLADAKAWLRVDTGLEDAAISALIVSARMLVEAATRRALVTQGWRIVADQWSQPPRLAVWLDPLASLFAPRGMKLPLAPLIAAPAIRVYDSSGQAQALDPSTWRLVDAPERARLVFASPPPQPGQTAAGIEIDVVAGYGDPPDVPAPLRQAILALVAHLYDNRGDAAQSPDAGLPPPVAAMLAPLVRRRLA